MLGFKNKAVLRYGPVLALLAITAPVYIHAIRPQHHWGGDFSVYVSQARNLVEGQPFYSSTYVVTPQSALNHPSAYPPVPSLLIAPVYSVFGLDYRALKLGLAFWAWFSMAFWYWLGCRLGLPPLASAVAVLLFSLGSLMFPIIDMIGSDGVNLFFSGAALLAIVWVEQEELWQRRPIQAAGLVSILLLLCVATRSTGMALLGAFGLNEVCKIWRGRKLTPYTFWVLGLLGVWLLFYQLRLYNSAQQYGSQFTLNGSLILKGAIFYLRSGASLWSSAPTVLRYTLAGFLLVLAVPVFVRRRWGIAEWYAAVFYLMLCLYTGSNDFRYILPLLPVLLFFATDSILYLGQRFYARHPALPALILAGVALAATSLNLTGIETGEIKEGIGKPSFQEVVTFLKTTPAETLILSWNPRVFAFYTRHPSALYPQRVSEFESQIPPASHVLLVKYEQPLDQEKLNPYLATAASPAVFSNAEFTVYQIR
jgi:hypothetical protein